MDKESAYRYFGSLENACIDINEILLEGDVIEVLETHQCQNGMYVEKVRLRIVADDTGVIFVVRYRVRLELTS